MGGALQVSAGERLHNDPSPVAGKKPPQFVWLLGDKGVWDEKPERGSGG